MVKVAGHHARHALQKRCRPGRIIRQRTHGRHTMGFDIRLIDHIHTQPITQSVKTRLVRIVRAAHGIKIVLLHQAQVPFHIGKLFEVACGGIVFVLVHTANEQWLTIET